MANPLPSRPSSSVKKDTALTFTQISEKITLFYIDHGEMLAPINDEQQSCIYRDFVEVFPYVFFKGQQPYNWIAEVSSIDLSQWLIGLSLFVQSDYRDILIEGTVKIIADTEFDFPQEIIEPLLYHLALFPEADWMLTEMSATITGSLIEHAKRSEWLPISVIPTMFYGMHKIQVTKSVELVLQALLPHLQALTQKKEKLYAVEIAYLLWGLKNMQDLPIVKKILYALLPHVRQERLDAPSLVMAFYGLQNMGISKSVCQMLLVLWGNVEMSETLDLQAVSAILHALRNKPDIPIIQSILTALVPHMRMHIQQEQYFVAPQLGRAFSGLQMMLDGSQPVQLILKFLLAHLKKHTTLDNQTIHHILYSLQNMRDSPIVREILITLSALIQKNAEQEHWLELAEIPTCLYGLQYIEHHEEVSILLNAINLHLPLANIPHYLNRKQWLAEIIYAVRYHLNQHNPSALVLIQSAAKIFAISQDFSAVTNEEERVQLIFSLLGYELDKLNTGLEFDFQYLSFHLMQELSLFLLNKAKDDQSFLSLDIIFASEEDTDYVQQERERVLRQTFVKFINEEVNISLKFDWEDYAVTIFFKRPQGYKRNKPDTESNLEQLPPVKKTKTQE